MFSPKVGTNDTVGRLELIYEDGSVQVHHLLCDPEDVTHYSHWFEEKHLQATTKVHKDVDARLGYCHMLARRQAHNDSGSALVRIRVFKVRYDYPSPDDDAREFPREQMGPPDSQVEPPFWQYDVASGKGRWL